jgi:hypothetical protein
MCSPVRQHVLLRRIYSAALELDESGDWKEGLTRKEEQKG